jgi:RNA polymerase sigma-70 factor (ECF subfamily)
MTKYYPRVYASLYSYTKSREDSEDLTQQTFVKVWQQIKTFRGDSAFFTWVYRIAINLAKNHFASSSSKKDKLNISSSDIDIEFKTFANPESDLMHDQSLKKIRAFIDKLPESLKTAFTLRESDGKSYEEIALITDTPIGTVRSRIFRARENILNFISEELDDES